MYSPMKYCRRNRQPPRRRSRRKSHGLDSASVGARRISRGCRTSSGRYSLKALLPSPLPLPFPGFLCGGAAIQPVDHVLVLRLHHAPLDLERGRQLARLPRELAGQERDLFDLLELREVWGHLLDELLIEGHDLRPLDQLLAARERPALLAGPP